MRINPLTATDFYKVGHIKQYPEGTDLIYSNFTPRSNEIAKQLGLRKDHIVFFGLQYFIKEFLIKTFNENFFQLPKEQVVKQYQKRMDASLGEGAVDTKHIGELHDLGYLPLEIKAIPEGKLSKIGLPVLTIRNTLDHYFWLTNYIESVLSCMIWKPCTSATIAHSYKELLVDYAEATGGEPGFIPFQGHDFSFRGMSGIQDASASSAGHLLSFVGTDTISAIDFLEQYYNAANDDDLIGCSVPATEHSVMCMGGEETELETFKRLINQVYPNGIVSIVSDTWDFWKVVTEYVATLKPDILARDGKVVIRPDSGDPVKIICGDPKAQEGTPEHKGAVECLWDVFGGTTNDEGYKLLDPHIGLIYGDSITYDRAKRILTRLMIKGFASTNIVFGIGSFTYQYNTRDTFGFAMKATFGIVNGEPKNIHKDPKTDDGTKKSAKGLLRVEGNILHQEQTEEQEKQGDLIPVFKDGKLLVDYSLKEIRELLATQGEE